jgi:hypothetical protein
MLGKKTPINVTFFDTWNEISAYVLGYWWADGSINISLRKSGARRYSKFEISSVDVDHLKLIANKMSWGGSVKIRAKKNKSGFVTQCGYFTFSDIHIINRLIQLGGMQNKSSHETSMPPIPAKLFHHFVRGFFDGDGSIYVRHYKNRHGKEAAELGTSFTAGKDTGDFLNNLKNKIREFIPVGDKKICGKISKKLVFNQYDTMLLCKWMYRKATIYLDRKKEIWDNADKKRLKNSQRYFSNKV